MFGTSKFGDFKRQTYRRSFNSKVYILIGATCTLKGKNMLDIWSIFFPLIVAHLGRALFRSKDNNTTY